MAAIPALIVSGYLGSGKTTLVGHLLAEAQANGVKLAIISNEFGDTGIDRALLDAGQEGFVELDGGCVCCRLSDALPETVQTIIEATQPDRLVLETSGVALPGEVQIQFWRAPISELISEEVVVVLVDAERAANGENLSDTFEEQLGAADLVLLNKCDLVDADQLAKARSLCDEMSAGQPIIEAVQAQVDPGLLFPPDPEGARTNRRDDSAAPHAHTHERFTTLELRFDDGVCSEAVLEQVRAQHAIRAKGFVRTDEGVRVLQGVGPRLELTEPTTPIPDGLIGRVVIIHKQAGHDHHDHS